MQRQPQISCRRREPRRLGLHDAPGHGRSSLRENLPIHHDGFVQHCLKGIAGMCCGAGKSRLEMNRHRSPRGDVCSRRNDRACRRNPASLPFPFEGEMFFRSGRTRGSCRRNRRPVATPHHQHQSQSERRAPGFPSLHAIDLQPDTSSAQVAREMPTPRY